MHRDVRNVLLRAPDAVSSFPLELTLQELAFRSSASYVKADSSWGKMAGVMDGVSITLPTSSHEGSSSG